MLRLREDGIANSVGDNLRALTHERPRRCVRHARQRSAKENKEGETDLASIQEVAAFSALGGCVSGPSQTGQRQGIWGVRIENETEK
jgi:hypothetical protein